MKAPSIQLQQIDDLLAGSEVSIQTIFDKVTLVALRLPNGFVLTASSGAVSQENYDEKIGASVCMRQIKDELWKLEGYALQKRVADGPNETVSRLLTALRGLTGVTTKAEGEAILAGLRMMPVPSSEMPPMTEAIELLMELSEK